MEQFLSLNEHLNLNYWSTTPQWDIQALPRWGNLYAFVVHIQ